MPDFDSINWTGPGPESSSENEIKNNKIQRFIKYFARKKEPLFLMGQALFGGGRPARDRREGQALRASNCLHRQYLAPLVTPN